ncbi:hypothetical protein [Oceanobacillus caeni]|uniref:DUF4064 domain-containing protein n=1 Tax=Oceanobacillus caeni TaxID=405946 RepID=A0ABR5MK02_9BACI|nr:hypothetical protein [Oceanobacillus caeni]KPH76056.1 hypothetical protein AFL42_07035 [Oceanobacillus caeni]
MIVKLNGNYWFDTDEQITDDLVVLKKSNELRKFAITLWTSTGVLFTQKVHAQSFYESMSPLTDVFQDIALGLGILFALAGFILLGFKRRWGTTTLKTTALVVGGVFLVPSLLMLVGIVGTLLNEALVEAFQNVRSGVEQ